MTLQKSRVHNKSFKICFSFSVGFNFTASYVQLSLFYYNECFNFYSKLCLIVFVEMILTFYFYLTLNSVKLMQIQRTQVDGLIYKNFCFLTKHLNKNELICQCILIY